MIVTKLFKGIYQESDSEEIWLRIKEVCQLLKISRSTLKNYKERGLIHHTVIRNEVCFKASDIEHAMKMGYRKSNIGKQLLFQKFSMKK